MLDDLIVHYEKNSDSLLARIYGMYTLKSQYFSSVDVIIMKNIAYMEKSKDKMVFDIKGSTVNRFVNLPDERFNDTNFNQKSILKDMNYIKINKAMDYQLL